MRQLGCHVGAGGRLRLSGGGGVLVRMRRFQFTRLAAIFAVVLAYPVFGAAPKAFAICAPPTVASISPATGSSAGGTSVTITGTGFACGADFSVQFGSAFAVSTLVGPTQITATSPPGLGTVDVTVSTEGGTSATSGASKFVYTSARPTVTSLTPQSGPKSGGPTVQIGGTNFTGATSVNFGSSSVSVFTVNDPTLIILLLPAGSGTVDVTVTTPGGTSATSALSQFTYTGIESNVSLTSSANPSQAGQSVTFTASVTGIGSDPTGTVTFKDGGTALATVALTGGRAAYATASLATGKHSITAVYSGDSGFDGGTSSVLVQAVNVPADSIKLKALQNQVTPLVAQAYGAAITGAIDGAIADAFGDGGNPATVGPNGMTFNFTAEPRTETARRADDAFTSLGYAPRSSANKVPAMIAQREWSLWADVRGSGWNSNNSTADLKGTQVNVTAGLGRKLTPDLLVGVLAGYENFKYDSVSLTGSMKGDGGTIGTYAAWRLAPTLRWDAALAWSSISYDGVAGTASGSFTGQRWLASTGLTGTYKYSSFVLEPSSKI